MTRNRSGSPDFLTQNPTPKVSESEIAQVLDTARAARKRSYAPYSNFPMGAAVIGANKVITPGALIESISLGLAMCAERVATFAAIAAGSGEIQAVALIARRTAGELTTPCGACLQVLLEHAGEDCLVICEDPAGDQETWRLGDLAPHVPLPRHRRPGNRPQ
jgi:cytidine deaminase